MEIRDWAQQLLFSPDLKFKLSAPDRLTDLRPGSAIETPRRPARAGRLDFRKSKAASQIAFPRASQLDKDHARGIVLHFFANHELLALELMALVLLKFPDAPPAFRKGLCGIIQDEQRHMGLYLDRMGHLGVEFGDVPLNDYFWNSISTVQTPAQFNARMALTFEQANLDYALHYAGALRTVGDEATGAVLDIILADEIKHVAHGLRWFEAERDKSVSLFDAWEQALCFPLTPARGKGLGFADGPRLQAGLPQSYIDRLRIYSHSKGRPPTVWAFNPNCEAQIAAKGGFNAKASLAQLTADLSTLPMLGVAADDAVVVPHRPAAEWLKDLQALDFVVPEFVVAPDLHAGAKLLGGRRIGGLKPWGWGPIARATWGPLCAAAKQSPPEWPLELFAKTFAAAHHAECVGADRDVPTVVRSIEAAVDAAGILGGEVVLKAPLGAAGRNAIRFEGTPTEAQRNWMRRQISTQGALVVERWRDRVADYSCLFEVTDRGTRVLGQTRFLTDDRGAYRGAVLGRMGAGLPVDVLRFLNGQADVATTLRTTAERVGAVLGAEGFRGAAGIDALLYRTTDGLHLNPMLEINPRQTMGHIALALSKRLSHGTTGLWMHLRAKEAPAGFPDLHRRLRELLPTDTVRTPVQHLRQGAVATTDPAVCQSVWTVLLVARKTQTLVDVLDAVQLNGFADALKAGPP